MVYMLVYYRYFYNFDLHTSFNPSPPILPFFLLLLPVNTIFLLPMAGANAELADIDKNDEEVCKSAPLYTSPLPGNWSHSGAQFPGIMYNVQCSTILAGYVADPA